MREVFARYLGDGCPACVDKPRLDARQAIALIQGAGGVAALAHPPHDLRESTLQALVADGLQAIEVDGPGFSNGKSQRLRDLGRPARTGRHRRQRLPCPRPPRPLGRRHHHAGRHPGTTSPGQTSRADRDQLDRDHQPEFAYGWLDQVGRIYPDRQ